MLRNWPEEFYYEDRYLDGAGDCIHEQCPRCGGKGGGGYHAGSPNHDRYEDLCEAFCRDPRRLCDDCQGGEANAAER